MVGLRGLLGVKKILIFKLVREGLRGLLEVKMILIFKLVRESRSSYPAPFGSPFPLGTRLSMYGRLLIWGILCGKARRMMVVGIWLQEG